MDQLDNIKLIHVLRCPIDDWNIKSIFNLKQKNKKPIDSRFGFQKNIHTYPRTHHTKVEKKKQTKAQTV